MYKKLCFFLFLLACQNPSSPQKNNPKPLSQKRYYLPSGFQIVEDSVNVPLSYQKQPNLQRYLQSCLKDRHFPHPDSITLDGLAQWILKPLIKEKRFFQWFSVSAPWNPRHQLSGVIVKGYMWDSAKVIFYSRGVKGYRTLYFQQQGTHLAQTMAIDSSLHLFLWEWIPNKASYWVPGKGTYQPKPYGLSTPVLEIFKKGIKQRYRLQNIAEVSTIQKAAMLCGALYLRLKRLPYQEQLRWSTLHTLAKSLPQYNNLKKTLTLLELLLSGV